MQPTSLKTAFTFACSFLLLSPLVTAAALPKPSTAQIFPSPTLEERALHPTRRWLSDAVHASLMTDPNYSITNDNGQTAPYFIRKDTISSDDQPDTQTATDGLEKRVIHYINTYGSGDCSDMFLSQTTVPGNGRVEKRFSSLTHSMFVYSEGRTNIKLWPDVKQSRVVADLWNYNGCYGLSGQFGYTACDGSAC